MGAPVALCLTAICIAAVSAGMSLAYIAETRRPVWGPSRARQAAWVLLTVSTVVIVLTTIRLLQVTP